MNNCFDCNKNKILFTVKNSNMFFGILFVKYKKNCTLCILHDLNSYDCHLL